MKEILGLHLVDSPILSMPRDFLRAQGDRGAPGTREEEWPACGKQSHPSSDQPVGDR